MSTVPCSTMMCEDMWVRLAGGGKRVKGNAAQRCAKGVGTPYILRREQGLLTPLQGGDMLSDQRLRSDRLCSSFLIT